MRFFKNIFPKKTEQKSLYNVIPLVPGSFLESAFRNFGRFSSSQAYTLFSKNSTIATAVDKIAGKVEQITPILKDKNDRIIYDHPILDLLSAPNPFNVWKTFIGDLCRSYLLTHNTYFSMLGNINFLPLEMYSVKPQNVSTVQAADYFPQSFIVTIGPGKGSFQREEKLRRVRFVDSNLKEFYFFKGFSSRSDELFGDSPLEAALLETKQQIKGRLHNLNVLEQGGRLSLIIAFQEDDSPDDDEHQARKKRINEDLSGTENAGKIAVVSGPRVTVTEAGLSNKDMDFSTLDKIASQVIYMRYEIPLPLITTDASTYNNFEQALLDFYENTVLPLTDRLFDELTKALMPRSKSPELKIAYDPQSINVLIRQKLAETKQKKDIGIETINELRASIPNREPIKGGNILYQPANMMPVGEDLFTEDNLKTPEQLAAELVRDSEVED